jgi:Phytanoyl-CoA dioxygenase (PhyH)
VLSDQQVEAFVEQGFVHLEGVVAPEVVAAGREVLWSDLGRAPDDGLPWTEPVVRLIPSVNRPFQEAAETPLLSGAFDRLVGAGRWIGRSNLGYFVIRLPHPADPGDTGWHIDASFPPEEPAPEDYNHWHVNVYSRERALLMLFLFSDVGPDDAPTRIRVGSHLDLPPLLLPEGVDGINGYEASALAATASASRPIAQATGAAGDVYLCHPFLVHAAQPLRGATPRFMAQPPLAWKKPAVLHRPHHDYSPVEIAIRRGLGEYA